MGGDYSREAIILNISVTEGRLFEGGDYFKYFRQRWAIIRGRRLIKGRLLFEESLSKHMITIFLVHNMCASIIPWVGYGLR